MSPVFVIIRASKRLLVVAGYLLTGALWVALIFPWLKQARRADIKQHWSGGLLTALGVDLPHDVAPLADLPHGLLVANHISFIDIFVINALAPVCFVAKSEVAAWPLIGWLTARTDNLFIERGHRGAAHRTQQAMSAGLSAGQRLVIFPEGTTTHGGEVLPFHAALLQSAVVSGMPIICLALGYQDAAGRMTAAPAYIDADTLWDCLWRIVTHERIVARITLVGCLTSRDGDRRQLSHQAHQCIARKVASWYAFEQGNLDVTQQQSSCHWRAEECDVSQERTGERHESDPAPLARTARPCNRTNDCFPLPFEPGT